MASHQKTHRTWQTMLRRAAFRCRCAFAPILLLADLRDAAPFAEVLPAPAGPIGGPAAPAPVQLAIARNDIVDVVAPLVGAEVRDSLGVQLLVWVVRRVEVSAVAVVEPAEEIDLGVTLIPRGVVLLQVASVLVLGIDDSSQHCASIVLGSSCASTPPGQRSIMRSPRCCDAEINEMLLTRPSVLASGSQSPTLLSGSVHATSFDLEGLSLEDYPCNSGCGTHCA
ncbi:hypothetical protein K437DRAFT_472 [Tilletiaria anomala UBC 951]|uniref:Uncharacterized protein n=1 Tax=Tilletiaria anomala (strain ATCC 24038 / CBS 436.72 / UBC 951) TaxID=1037660 RepID=A0A066WR80_TILAU|nr:uncharacterized protein K437DRAFT_472 [Tilletiaria anomala UBC 951]KDN53509.1 hypothetical protein K437DRAFT_472 [Tilletiaria anomala UBC 951]